MASQDLMNFIFALAQVVLAVVATIIAMNQRKEQKYDIRIENLKKMTKSIRVERYYYARESLEYYRKQFAGDPDACADQVLFRKEWVQAEDDPWFVPLDQVELDLEDGLDNIWDSNQNPQPKFLPMPREGYAENAKFYCDVNLMNLPLYGLGGVKIQGTGKDKKVTLKIVKGHYYDFYDTCEVLSAEMAYNRRIMMQRDLSAGHLPLRDAVKDVFDLTNRFAGIGINALTILQNVQDEEGNRRNYFLLHKRSTKNVAEGANSYHVVPAGSYQPATVEFPEKVQEADRNLNSTVVREFAEELLGEEEFSSLFNSELILSYKKVPTASLIGIGLDPLNTKTEIMACLVLDVDQTPVFGGEKTAKAIQERLIESYEGSVTLKELSLPMIKQFRDNPMSIPAFRQILSVVHQHPDEFGVSVK